MLCIIYSSSTPASAIKFENSSASQSSGVKIEAPISDDNPLLDNKSVVCAENKKVVDKLQNRQLAWDQIIDDKSWIIASEKEAVLTESFGLSCCEDLSFLTKKEIDDLMSKLKTVPARKFESYISSSM